MSTLQKYSVLHFKNQKKNGEKIVVLTAYDYPTAKLLDEAGVDAILVGDSVANVVQGKRTTVPVTLDEMIYHAELVARAAKRAFVIVDLPFPYCQSGPASALAAAVRIVKETQADAVKIEGGASRAELIRVVVDAGIPVMGHCGLMPQSVLQLGEFSLQRDLDALINDVQVIEAAGAFAVVLECIPSKAAEKAKELLSIPTIGIGAGEKCDGQVLVLHDLIGLSDFVPKHVKQYANVGQIISDAVARFCADVRSR